MRIFRHYTDIPDSVKNAVVAIGNFDGVHRGHQALLARTRELAQRRGVPFGVMAFEPHPQEFFRPSPESFRLTPFRTKARLLAEAGADVLFALPFDASLAAKHADAFVRDILVDALHVSGVVVGADFQFGKDRSGNAASLSKSGAEKGFAVEIFEPVPGEGAEKISSSSIRAALKAGKPEEAAKLLGRPWAIESRIEHGDARGRELGFPTANMHLVGTLAPAFGIYAVRASVLENDKLLLKRDGVASFGMRPMFETSAPLFETYLFDFEGDLYGKHMSVDLIAWLRPELKLDGLPALKARIAQDCAQARAILAAA